MSQRRAHFTISEPNFQWLQAHAPNEKGMSRVLDDLLQKERALGPIETRMHRQADRLDTILSQQRS